jgi:hypothetical protein
MRPWKEIARAWKGAGPLLEATYVESLTVRINRSAHKTLRELSAMTNESMTDVLDKAIEAYRRECLLEALNASFAAVRSDANAWAELQQEQGLWDSTLQDGLEDE